MYKGIDEAYRILVGCNELYKEKGMVHPVLYLFGEVFGDSVEALRAMVRCDYVVLKPLRSVKRRAVKKRMVRLFSDRYFPQIKFESVSWTERGGAEEVFRKVF